MSICKEEWTDEMCEDWKEEMRRDALEEDRHERLMYEDEEYAWDQLIGDIPDKLDEIWDLTTEFIKKMEEYSHHITAREVIETYI